MFNISAPFEQTKHPISSPKLPPADLPDYAEGNSILPVAQTTFFSDPLLIHQEFLSATPAEIFRTSPLFTSTPAPPPCPKPLFFLLSSLPLPPAIFITNKAREIHLNVAQITTPLYLKFTRAPLLFAFRAETAPLKWSLSQPAQAP